MCVKGVKWKKARKAAFSFVGQLGTDLRIKVKHIRKSGSEQIAAIIGAEVVYLEAGKHDEDEDEE